MKTDEITGKEFKSIILKTGYNMADFSRHLKRDRTFAAHLVERYANRAMPIRYMIELTKFLNGKGIDPKSFLSAPPENPKPIPQSTPNQEEEEEEDTE